MTETPTQVLTDRPIEQDQLTVNRKRSPNLGCTDPILELLKEFRVAGRYGLKL